MSVSPKPVSLSDPVGTTMFVAWAGMGILDSSVIRSVYVFIGGAMVENEEELPLKLETSDGGA